MWWDSEPFGGFAAPAGYGDVSKDVFCSGKGACGSAAPNIKQNIPTTPILQAATCATNYTLEGGNFEQSSLQHVIEHMLYKALPTTTSTQPQHTTTTQPQNTTTNTQPQTHKTNTQPQRHNHKHTTTKTQQQTHNRIHNHKDTTANTQPQTHTTANTQPQTQPQTHNHKHNHNHNTAHNHSTQPEDPQAKSRSTILTTMATFSSLWHQDK